MLYDTHVLWAKKNKRKTSSSSTSENTGGGGGFGKSTPLSTSTSPVAVLPFSGHSGSGTKALRRVANQYDAIRKRYGVSEACRDVYVRSPVHSNTTYWFVGKIACVPSVDDKEGNDTREAVTDDDNDNQQHMAIDTPRFIQTALLLKRIIFEYSKDQLRPQAMAGRYASTLELWLAPGDSEMDVATNKVTLRPVRGSLTSLTSDSKIKLTADDIGYNPEIYVGDERIKGGLRVERDEFGGKCRLSQVWYHYQKKCFLLSLC
jgi:hypothetical protein